MYPYLLSERDYPVKPLYYRQGISPRELVDLAGAYGVIASVSVFSQVPEYPHRTDDGVRYPVGRYDTTLTGPEILSLWDEGGIVSVRGVAVYALGRPYAGVMGDLLAARAECRQRGDYGYEMLFKLMANSLSGKLAQRPGHWKRLESNPHDTDWGVRYTLDTRTGIVTRDRIIAGICERWIDEPHKPRLLGASYAYMTAYARMMMRSIREYAGERQVISQDTDGLWVLSEGLGRLRNRPDIWGDRPGLIREVCSVPCGVWLGPRHYWTPLGWVLSGFSDPVVDPDNLIVVDQCIGRIGRTPPEGVPRTVLGRFRNSSLGQAAIRRYGRRAGWVKPDQP
jgi:hypothetical protein